MISGGGTGGHIFPAVSIGHALKLLNPENELLFVGAKGRMEMDKVPAAGYRIIGLNITGFQRRLSMSNLLLPFRVLESVLESRKIIREFKPDAAVGVGGYASGPLLFAASTMRVPTLIQEQNSFAGMTNRILAKRATKICVAYDGMEKYFPKDKILMTGNPVRQDIQYTKGKREEALRFFNLRPDRPVLLVIGGSLGARTINEAIDAGLDRLASSGIQLIWQTGKSYFEKAKASAAGKTDGGIRVLDFIGKMDLAYAASDAVVSRAGASSVSELAICAKPAILVPSPNVAEDHQTRNAMALVVKEAAILVKDNACSRDLIDTVVDLLQKKDLQSKLSVNISAMALPGAAETIAKEVYRLAGHPIN